MKVLGRCSQAAVLLGCITLLAGCGSSRDGLPGNFHSFDANDVPNAIPKVEPKSRYGNPASYVVFGKRYFVSKSAHCYHAKGIASWYGTKFHERRTSSSEPYDMFKMTAANKVLPLPTYVRVHNLKNGRTIIVKVNDRGPFHENRIIDLSFAAGKKLDMTKKGTALVEVTAIDPRHPNQTYGSTKPAPKAPMADGHPQIYLQLGAFSDRVNAEDLAKQLASHVKVPIFVNNIHKNGRDIYKVQLGPIPSVDESDTVTKQLKREGFGDAFAIVR